MSLKIRDGSVYCSEKSNPLPYSSFRPQPISSRLLFGDKSGVLKSMKPFAFFLLLLLATSSYAANPVHYTLEYYSGNDFLTVSIQIPEAAGDQADSLIIPRSAPGTYSMTDYAAFVEQVTATTSDGVILSGEQGQGSYYSFDTTQSPLTTINYRINLKRMESVLAKTNGSVSAAARTLNISRQRLYRRAEELGLDIEKFRVE